MRRPRECRRPFWSDELASRHAATLQSCSVCPTNACSSCWPRRILSCVKRPAAADSSASRVEGEPVRISMCHCFACQRQTGSAFSMQARYPKEQVQVEGRYSDYVRKNDEGERADVPLLPRLRLDRLLPDRPGADRRPHRQLRRSVLPAAARLGLGARPPASVGHGARGRRRRRLARPATDQLALLVRLGPSAELVEGLLGRVAVPPQPGAEHRPRPPDSAAAVNEDGPAVAERVVDRVQDAAQLVLAPARRSHESAAAGARSRTDTDGARRPRSGR